MALSKLRKEAYFQNLDKAMRRGVVLPEVPSGQWGGQAFRNLPRTKTIGLLYRAGDGVRAHPGTPAGGVRTLQQAWKAAIQEMT